MELKIEKTFKSKADTFNCINSIVFEENKVEATDPGQAANTNENVISKRDKRKYFNAKHEDGIKSLEKSKLQ